jgi:hypothetical protein
MIVAIAIGVAAGVMCAQFFSAYVIIPATVVALIGVLLNEAARGQTVTHAILASLSTALTLQSGFFFATFLIGIGLYGKALNLTPRSSRHHHW